MFEEGEIDGEEEEILEQEKHDMNIYTLIKINKYINKYILHAEEISAIV